MKKLHKPSGYTIEIAVVYYSEIEKYSPGAIIINQAGRKTQRIATESRYYNSSEEAEKASYEYGKMLLSKHLSNSNPLSFDHE